MTGMIARAGKRKSVFPIDRLLTVRAFRPMLGAPYKHGALSISGNARRLSFTGELQNYAFT